MRNLLLLLLVLLLYLIWFNPFRKSLRLPMPDGSALNVGRSSIELGGKVFDISTIKRLSFERVGDDLFEVRLDNGSSVFGFALRRREMRMLLSFLGKKVL